MTKFLLFFNFIFNFSFYFIFPVLKRCFVQLVLFLVIFIFVFFVPKIYLINLKTQNQFGTSLYYNVGALVLQKPGVIDQYATRNGEYSTAYLTSLYEPSFKIDNEIFTAYRPKPQPIKYNGKTYFLYIGETSAFLAPNSSQIPVYKNNLIVGPSIGLFGYGNSIYNYNWDQIISNYTTNQIGINVTCQPIAESNCGGVLHSLDFNGKPAFQDNSPLDGFDLNYQFNITPQISQKGIIPMASLVIPDGFSLCPSMDFNIYDCLDPKEKEQINYPEMPLKILGENYTSENNNSDFELKTLKDLNLTQFYLNNLKISDKYTVKTSDPIIINNRNDYYLVHSSGKIAIKVNILNAQNGSGDIQKQFGTIRFYGDKCYSEACKISIRIELIAKN